MEVRKSRFECLAGRADHPEAALAFIASHARSDASHNCWAYRIGPLYRSSDDGEPAGTAGRPILAAIDGRRIDRVVVLVSRWFGGIKLGAGGLARSYGGCASECLRQAGTEPLLECIQASAEVDFADSAIVHQLLDRHHAEKLATRHHARGTLLTLILAADRLQPLDHALRQATHGRCRLLPCDASQAGDTHG